jgi:hypothetical protein
MVPKGQLCRETLLLEVLRGKPVMGSKDVAKGVYVYNHLDLVILNTVTAMLRAVTVVLTPIALQVARALHSSPQQPRLPVVQREPLPVNYLLVIRASGRPATTASGRPKRATASEIPSRYKD